ncbi:pentapeptide repeat-containing protein [Saccharophagus degradans]|uniref:Pentapeptide repeat-containing protein n=1 Tax=Saccharophagus degradans TaxID=86304 RepID=A0AAW7X4A5_9GAMM|nr:pentapeptide repeat-containing protein [Saccharophagus degradans]MDO6421378.1 pentapeptide repeat-containing protein [Saccharophagus degradans]MDO6609574.1 pentapeptide repeat-containing protein [Saccharophagus degradans]
MTNYDKYELTQKDFSSSNLIAKSKTKVTEDDSEINVRGTLLTIKIDNRTTSKSINLKECQAEKLTINECEFEKDVTISNCEFNETLEFKGCTFKNLIFENCNFAGSFKISEETTAKEITLKDCTFSNTVYFLQTKIDDTIKIKNSTFKSGLIISSNCSVELNHCDGDISIEMVADETNDHRLTINSQRNANIFIAKAYAHGDETLPSIDTIWISNIHDLKSLAIDRFIISRLIVQNSVINCSFLLKNINVNELDFYYLTNKAGEEMILNGISPLGNKSKFQLRHSSLGSAQIRNCKLSDFSEFKFIESEIDRVLSRNTEWPFKVETQAPQNEDQDQDKDNSTRGLEAYYRACKDIYEKSGERARSLEFKSRHTELQYKSTEWNWPNFPYKLAILISSLSSDHGTNWIKALLWLLLSTSVSTVLIIIASIFLTGTNGIECFCTQFGTFNLSSIFFQLLLPTHKFDALVGVEAHFLTYAIDMLTRVANGYLIFQIIKSSRSYSQ